jgi:hypothetical protein
MSYTTFIDFKYLQYSLFYDNVGLRRNKTFLSHKEADIFNLWRISFEFEYFIDWI